MILPLLWSPELASLLFQEAPETRTTLMIRKVPRRLNQADLAKMVDCTGKTNYDLIYCPVDVERCCNRGYAFLSFRDPSSCTAFKNLFAEGANRRSLPPGLRGCDVVYAHVQGSETTLQHIRSRRPSPDSPPQGPATGLTHSHSSSYRHYTGHSAHSRPSHHLSQY